MKIKNKVVGIISVICMLLNMSVVNAAQHEINYIKSLDGDFTTISGTVTNGANKDVLIRIDYTNTAPSADTENLENNVIYQKQLTTDSNGYFEFNVKLNEISNNSYTLRIGVLGDENDISETFVFYGESYRNTALSAIQTAQNNQDAEALANAIITYYPNLYLQTPLFNAYQTSDPDLSEIKSVLISYPVITTVSALEDALEGAVIVKDLKQSTNYTSMQNVFGTYDSTLDILDSTIYQLTYSNLSESIKGNIYNTFKGKPYYTPTEIKDAFTLSVLNTYLANAIGADSVRQVLGDNATMLGINMSDYNLSDDKFMGLIGTEFATVASVKTTLDGLKNQSGGNQQGAGQNPGPGTGGNGGSGGGGGISGPTVVPTVGQNTVTGNLSTESYPFNDMEEHVWAKEATLALYKSGVLHGVGDNNFAPERVITREEFLKLIINGFGITAQADNEVSFGDVNKEQWYYPFVKTGVNSGIIHGMDNNKFGIGNQITRQDMVVMLYRALNMKKEISDGNGFSSFEDYDSISDYAKSAVAFAEANEIVNGMGDGNFHPQSSATRAEAAVILYRAIEYLSNNI